jgi:hypothetical protein
MASVFRAPAPSITTTEVMSAGLLRKAMPRPAASSSGKTKTQNTTSGSRLSSMMRAQSRWRYPVQRPLRRALPRVPRPAAGADSYHHDH